MVASIAWLAALALRPGSRLSLVFGAAGAVGLTLIFATRAALFRRSAAIIVDGQGLVYRDRWGRTRSAATVPGSRIVDVVLSLPRGMKVRRWVLLAPTGRGLLTIRVDKFTDGLGQISTELAVPVEKLAASMSPKEFTSSFDLRLPLAERNMYAMAAVIMVVVTVLLLTIAALSAQFK
jgi:hypothetical protein